jgi:hypothetical protein
MSLHQLLAHLHLDRCWKLPVLQLLATIINTNKDTPHLCTHCEFQGYDTVQLDLYSAAWWAMRVENSIKNLKNITVANNVD